MNSPTTRTPPERKRIQPILARYQQPDVRSSVRQLVTSFIPYVLLWVAMVLSLRVSYWADAAAGRAGRGLPGAQLHHLPRLLPRLVLQVAQGERRGGDHHRPADVHPVLSLAARPCGPPCHGGRPGPPRGGRCADADGRRIPGAATLAALHLQLLAPPADPAHDRPVRDVHDHPAVPEAERRKTRADQRARDDSCAGRHRGGHDGAAGVEDLPAGPGPGHRDRDDRRGSGCSTCSTTTMARIGSATTSGTLRLLRSTAARSINCRRCCSGSAATSASITSTT